MRHEEAETVSPADVLRFFFNGKAQDLKADNREFYVELLAISDDQEFIAAVKSRWPPNDDNSVVGWTVGTVPFNRSHEVIDWVKTEVGVDTIYSKGIDDSVRPMLYAARGNLKDLAEILRPDPIWASQHRFSLDREPGDDFYIIGVHHTSSIHNGTVELLDGSHRLVAMAAQGKTTVKAYLAELH